LSSPLEGDVDVTKPGQSFVSTEMMNEQRLGTSPTGYAPTASRKVICTLGPSSLKPRIIRRLQAVGVSLFRINLSHTAIEDVRPAIAFLQEHSTVPVCLDSEGAQVRTGTFLAPPTNLKKDSLIHRR
jgi:hypothetical protein